MQTCRLIPDPGTQSGLTDTGRMAIVNLAAAALGYGAGINAGRWSVRSHRTRQGDTIGVDAEGGASSLPAVHGGEERDAR
jgi:hypothetical protein